MAHRRLIIGDVVVRAILPLRGIRARHTDVKLVPIEGPNRAVFDFR